MMKLIVAFRNFANAPKNVILLMKIFFLLFINFVLYRGFVYFPCVKSSSETVPCVLFIFMRIFLKMLFYFFHFSLANVITLFVL
jgi:hypothetical protein